MRYEEVLVTPEMAKKFLEKNDVNRRYEPKRAASYSKDMLAGKWELNGEDIAISTSGNLKNGQHRLSAIIIANIPVKLGIKFDVPENITIYDKGRNRSTSDTLAAKGFDKNLSSSIIIAMIRLHYTYCFSQMYVTDSEIENFINKHKYHLETVMNLLKGKTTTKHGTRLNCKNAGILLPVFYALYSDVDETELNDFLEVLYTGLPTSLDQSSAIVLRNDIQSTKTEGGWSRKAIAMMTEKAIQDYHCHFRRKMTYKNSGLQIYSKVFKTFEGVN